MQQQVTLEENRKLVGKTVEVMVEGESKLVSRQAAYPASKVELGWEKRDPARRGQLAGHETSRTQLVGRTRGDQVVCFDGDLSLKGEILPSPSPSPSPPPPPPPPDPPPTEGAVMSADPQTLSYESQPTTLSGIGLGTIALQIVGVYCIALALPILSSVVMFLSTSGAVTGARAGWQVLLNFVMPSVFIVFGVLLIRVAPRLSAWLFGDSVGGVMAGPITAPVGQYLQAIAFSVAGVLTMVGATPRLVSLIWLALMGMGSRLGGYSDMIEPVVQFLLGLALFLQSKGLSLMWHKIRTGGVIDPAAASVHSDSDKA
jgi:hypothetical protein